MQMPLRAPAAASPATPAATAAGAGREEGYVGSPAVGSGGPLSGAQLVSTPEQLRRYMVCRHALRPCKPSIHLQATTLSDGNCLQSLEAVQTRALLMT